MHDYQLPLHRIPDDSQMGDLPGFCMEVLAQRPGESESRTETFAMSVISCKDFNRPECRAQAAKAIVIVTTNPDAMGVLIDAGKQIEARAIECAAQPGKAQALPAAPKFKPRLSLRQMYAWMERVQSSFSSAELCVQGQGMSGSVLFCFVRTTDAIRDYFAETARLTREIVHPN